MVAKTKTTAKGASGKVSGRAAREPLTVGLPEFLLDGSDLRFREFIADLYAAVSGMHALRRALAATIELGAAEFSVLLATWYLQRTGQVGIKTIAQHLHAAPANVTADVGKLVRKGFLAKKERKQDSRAVDLALTRKGEAALDGLAPTLRRVNDRLFSGNTEESVRQIWEFLRHIEREATHSIRLVREHPPAKPRPKP